MLPTVITNEVAVMTGAGSLCVSWKANEVPGEDSHMLLGGAYECLLCLICTARRSGEWRALGCIISLLSLPNDFSSHGATLPK